MNTQFDPVMEDYLSFQLDHLPKVREKEAFLDWHPASIGSVITPRNKSHDELTPEQRTKRHILWMEDTDKFAVHVASSSASAGPTESDASFRRRFGLRSLRDLGESARIEPVAIHVFGESYYVDEALNIDLDRHSWKNDDKVPCPICDDTDTAAHSGWKPIRDVLDMSWPEQREFRWNDPEGYKQWVADLREEMGPHFDESLVLPPFKFGVREGLVKRREYHPEDEAELMLDFSPEEVPEEAY